jgi:hypothetical protein
VKAQEVIPVAVAVEQRVLLVLRSDGKNFELVGVVNASVVLVKLKS